MVRWVGRAAHVPASQHCSTTQASLVRPTAADACARCTPNLLGGLGQRQVEKWVRASRESVTEKSRLDTAVVLNSSDKSSRSADANNLSTWEPCLRRRAVSRGESTPAPKVLRLTPKVLRLTHMRRPNSSKEMMALRKCQRHRTMQLASLQCRQFRTRFTKRGSRRSCCHVACSVQCDRGVECSRAGLTASTPMTTTIN